MSGLINKLVTDGSVQILGQVPECPFASVHIQAVNPTASDLGITLWAGVGASPNPVDLLEYDVPVPANGGRYSNDCVIMSAGEKIFVKAPAGLVVRLSSVDEQNG